VQLREVYVYSNRNFGKEIKINLEEELRKGKHSIKISDIIP